MFNVIKGDIAPMLQLDHRSFYLSDSKTCASVEQGRNKRNCNMRAVVKNTNNLTALFLLIIHATNKKKIAMICLSAWRDLFFLIQ